MPRDTLVIRARVRARLLGLHLLTLDALVTADDEDRVATDEARVVRSTRVSSGAAVSGGAPRADRAPGAPIRAGRTPDGRSGNAGAGVARARQLVEQSERELHVLEQS